MMSGEFGVTNHVIEGQKSNTSIAMLGNGKIRVQALYFDNGCAGICIVDDGLHVKPYSTKGADELPDNAVDLDIDKIVVMATNKRSLQVVIDRLTEAKEFLSDEE